VAAEVWGDREAGRGAVIWLNASVKSNRMCSACVIQPLLDSPGGMFWLVEAAKAITASLQRREMPQVEQPKQRRKPR